MITLAARQYSFSSTFDILGVNRYVRDLTSLHRALDCFIRDRKFIPGGRTNQVSVAFFPALTRVLCFNSAMIDISSVSYMMKQQFLFRYHKLN